MIPFKSEIIRPNGEKVNLPHKIMLLGDFLGICRKKPHPALVCRMRLSLFRSFTIASVASNMSFDMNLFSVLDSVIFLNAIVLASIGIFCHKLSLPVLARGS